MPIRTLLLTLALVLAGGCAHPPAGADGSLRVIVLRHAEKDPAVADDPPLTAAGEQRAARIAQRLAASPPRAIYSTDTRRTRATAAPTAAATHLSLLPYDGEQAPVQFTATVRQAHPAGIVLVVGHSNTVPAIVAALCDCPVAPMDESEYDRWSEVLIDASGQVRLLQDRY